MPFSPPPESIARALFDAWYRSRNPGEEPPRLESLPAPEQQVFHDASALAWGKLP